MTAPVFILAGEPSGDRLAASLMRAINEAYGQQQWIGVGGPAMARQGLAGAHAMDNLTVMGFGAALTAYPRLSRFADKLVDEIMAARPRLVMTVDVKGFSLRLAARLKRRMAAEGWSAPIIHTPGAGIALRRLSTVCFACFRSSRTISRRLACMPAS